MDWTKLRIYYPLAYKLMEENPMCLYTTHSKRLSDLSGDSKLTYPVKRDLFDFFDDNQLHVGIVYDDCFEWSIVSEYENEDARGDLLGGSRTYAEIEAFIKAFEILNTRLKSNQ